MVLGHHKLGRLVKSNRQCLVMDITTLLKDDSNNSVSVGNENYLVAFTFVPLSLFF